jgi:multidrug efflux system membrane fusion protein
VAIDAYDRAVTTKLATGKLLAIDNEIDPTTGMVKIKAEFDNKDHSLFPSQFVNARMLVDTITNATLVPTAGIQHTPTSNFVYLFKKGDAPATKPAADATAEKSADKTVNKSKAGAERSDPGIPGTVTIREVTVGQSQPAIGPDEEDMTAILSGLEPGDVIVTDGVDKLLEGTRVLAHTSDTMAKHRSGATTMPSGGATTRPAGGHKRKTVAE